MKEFTKSELRRFNGKNGSAAYVAFRRKVYDVSSSYHWRQGEHWALHSAGEDLTDCLDKAPHSDSLLSRYPIVGVLSDPRG